MPASLTWSLIAYLLSLLTSIYARTYSDSKCKTQIGKTYLNARSVFPDQVVQCDDKHVLTLLTYKPGVTGPVSIASDSHFGSCEPVPEQRGIYQIIQCDFLTRNPITGFQFSDNLLTNFETAIRSYDYFLATIHNSTSCDEQGSDMAILLDHCFPFGENASMFATRNGKKIQSNC